MALHPDFPDSPHIILDPAIRWFPADEALRESSAEKLMPPLVSELRKQVKQWLDKGYAKATDTRVCSTGGSIPPIFCNDLIQGAHLWLQTAENSDNYKKNFPLFMQRYSHGLPPYIDGVPVIG